MEQKYKDALCSLFEQLDKLRPRALPEVPGRVSAVLPGAIIEAINRMARFAVTNAPTFDNVPPSKLDADVEGTAGAKQMPGSRYWGGEVIIVDAWAVALGNAVFYGTPAEYPKPLQIYFTQRLLQHFDSATLG